MGKCIITYKGKNYSEEQFKEYFINNKQEFATSIAKNKDVIDSFKRKMEGIDYVFSQSPELASIGNKAQYLQYLSTIFKTSKVKDIVYHGTGEKFDIFDFKLVGKTTKGFANAAFFTNDKNWAFSRFALADTHQVWGKEGVVLLALINIKNPKIFDTVFDFNKSIEEGIYKNLQEELNEKLRDIFPPVKSGKIYLIVNLNKQLKPEFKFVDENQREEKYSQLTGKYTVPKNITEQEYLNTLSKEERNTFLNKKQKFNSIISSYSTDIDKAIKGLTTKTAALSGKEDSVIQTHPNTDTKEYAVFEPEQIHILSSKADIQGFKEFVQGKQFQKLTTEEKAKTIEQVTKEHRSITALKDLAAKLAHRIGGKVEFENRTDVDWKGYNQGNTSVLNEAYMTPDTPFHEILAHPIIRAIKNQSDESAIEKLLKYKKQLEQLSPETNIWKIGNNNIANYLQIGYGDYWMNLPAKIAIKEINDRLSSAKTNSTLYQSLLKELETGKGKEVFEQVKRDYTRKENVNPYKEVYADEITEKYIKDNPESFKTLFLGEYQIYSKTINTWYIFTNEEGTIKTDLTAKELSEFINKNTDASGIVELFDENIGKYTLEEQQEEAIVTLLGLMAADKLDKIKDKNLISLLKELLLQMSEYIKSSFTAKEIRISELNVSNLEFLTNKRIEDFIKSGKIRKEC